MKAITILDTCKYMNKKIIAQTVIVSWIVCINIIAMSKRVI